LAQLSFSGGDLLKKEYVIYLSSGRNDIINAYGYWSGKNYVAQGELIPITDSVVTENTKIYSSKARADNALNTCLDRGYSYVIDGRVEEIN